MIDDVETLQAIAEPTRAALIELLAQPRTVTQLATALGVPRTRLYHHVELLQGKGIVEQVEERRAGALTEPVYALTARVIRPSARLLRSGDADERIAALLTLLFDTTKTDLRRAFVTGEADLDDRELGLGRSVAYLAPEQAIEFIRELDALVERFDAAHDSARNERPFAFVWAMYPLVAKDPVTRPAPLGSRSFRLLLSAHTLSSFGDALTALALRRAAEPADGVGLAGPPGAEKLLRALARLLD